MSLELIIALILFAIILCAITTFLLKKNLIPAKYSLLWYFISIVIFLVAVLSKSLEFFANAIGFQTLSNMVIGIILTLLIFLTMSLTIIVSSQHRRITLLVQELSLLKKEVNANKSHKK